MVKHAELEAWLEASLDPFLERIRPVSCWPRRSVLSVRRPTSEQLAAMEDFLHDDLTRCPLWHSRATVDDVVLHLLIVLPTPYLRPLAQLMALLQACEAHGYLQLPSVNSTHRIDVGRVTVPNPGMFPMP